MEAGEDGIVYIWLVGRFLHNLIGESGLPAAEYIGRNKGTEQVAKNKKEVMATTLVERITEEARTLQPETQQQVLDFAAFLNKEGTAGN